VYLYQQDELPMRIHDAKLPICARFCTEICAQNRKPCTDFGAICNLFGQNALPAAEGPTRGFSTEIPLSILTTSDGSQWRSSKIVGWL
jgi:hypothetical protein